MLKITPTEKALLNHDRFIVIYNSPKALDEAGSIMEKVAPRKWRLRRPSNEMAYEEGGLLALLDAYAGR